MTGLRERVPAAVPVFAPAVAVIALQQVVWPVSAGTFVSGVILGGLGSLIAVGMALIYRANNVVSFAQADLGALPATAAIVVMEVWGFTYWMSLIGGILVALLLGGIVELAFIRRFFGAPRLIVTVATIGVGQLLAFGSLTFPSIWHLTPTIRTFDPPFGFTTTVGAVVFDANDLMAVIVAPILLVGVAVFLRATDTGVAIRAAASAPDRASLLGIPVKRLQTQVWMIASLLAFLSVFLQAGVTGLPPGGLFTWGVLLRALAALVMGRMTNLGAVAASSVSLGILQSAMERANDGALVGPVLLAVILVALLAQRRGVSRLSGHQSGSWGLATEFHALPPEVARLGRVRAFRWTVAAVGIAVVLVLPHVLGTAGTLKAGAVLVFATIGLSMVVLAGWAGQVSLGQMAFVGLGGAVAAWSIVDHGVDPVVAMLAAGVVGAAAAVVVGIPALRLRGLNLAVVTLGMAVAASSALFSNEVIRWIPTGVFTRPRLFGRIDIDSPVRLYHLSLVILVLAMVAVRGLRRSRFGRVLVAQRDNEPAAASYGVNVVVAKLVAFAMSGFIAAVGGAVFVLHQAAFRDENYDVGAGVAVFVAAVIGGLGSPLGGVLAAVYLRGAQWLLPGNWQILASSAGVLLVLMMMPDGLGGLWFRTRNQIVRLLAGSSARSARDEPAADDAEMAA
ncbi:MAG: ABC transporter permease [Acidimicrobiales bacterium]